jgi:hypothetical protein
MPRVGDSGELPLSALPNYWIPFAFAEPKIAFIYLSNMNDYEE